MKFRVLPFLACLVAASAVSPALAGTVGTYYLTGPQGFDANGLNPTYSKTWVVQGDAIIRSWTNHQQFEFAIAVAGDVRTTGLLNPGLSSPAGSLYDLLGNYQGVTYQSLTLNTNDATTDGTYNYLVSVNNGPDDTGNGTVWRTNRDYTNPVALFLLPAGYEGITYDPTNNSVWVSGWYNSNVRDYSLTTGMLGTQLSQFSTGHNANLALALDPVTQHLWLNRCDNATWTAPCTLEEWSKAGDPLSTIANTPYTFGGEIIGPEPSSFALIGAGVLALWLKRRR